MDRRYFLSTAAGGVGGMAGLFAAGRYGWLSGRSPKGISKFRTTLPGLGPGGANNLGNFIPVLSPDTTTYPGTDYYEIAARQFTQTMHPAIGQTRLWGYGAEKDLNNKYLGGVIVATRGRPVKLKVMNLLPPTHLLPRRSDSDRPAVGHGGGRALRSHHGSSSWSRRSVDQRWRTHVLVHERSEPWRIRARIVVSEQRPDAGIRDVRLSQ